MSVQLNFARKWRSRNFDQIIGQDISVRILKNSLFLNYFFPVYLFSGQRGCGKTSMARIFAAALNCEQLSNFQQDPKKYSLPCLACISCHAMIEGKHPDFIEIDAASYTGVDNVRQIIDTAALLPLLGRKKVYLIDEAHMLSKAAFNAFLKILEEPPSSVLFILATTELHKIIDTVKSRSFQIFFKAVKPDDLLQHLAWICKQEEIEYEPEGLSLIIQATEGSVRDALNVLEQVRFAMPCVSREHVALVLGSVLDETIIDCIACVLEGDIAKLLHFMQQHKMYSFNSELLWRSLLEMAQAILLVGYGVKLTHFMQHEERLKQIAERHSSERLNQFLKIFYTNEISFSKTRLPYNFLEMMLLDCCTHSVTVYKKSSPSWSPQGDNAVVVSKATSNHTKKPDVVATTPAVTNVDQKWSIFLDAIERLNDPLLCSIFKQINSINVDDVQNIFTISFSKEFSFFKEWLENSIATWKPLLQKVFGAMIKEEIIFNDGQVDNHVHNVVNKQSNETIESKVIKRALPAMQQAYKNTDKHSVIKSADAVQLKKASRILQFFPGTLVEVKESPL